jgi:hypothetical protein
MLNSLSSPNDCRSASCRITVAPILQEDWAWLAFLGRGTANQSYASEPPSDALKQTAAANLK